MAQALKRSSRPVLRAEQLESRDTPTGILATGADPGALPVVTVYDADTHAQLFRITTYESSFTGGVNVAVGDVNADGTADIVTGAGSGGGPVINVYSGVDGSFLKSFTVGDNSSRAGASVAVADINQDGVADIIVGTMRNGEPLVQVLNFADGTVLHGYTPFSGATSVNVAAGDVNGDAIPDIVASVGSGGPPQVIAYDGTNDAVLLSASAFEDTFTGGVLISTGDLNGDNYADVIATAGAGGGPRVHVLSGRGGTSLQSFFAYDDQLRGGVRAYAYDADGDGTLDLVTANGTGQSSEMKAFNGTTLAELAAPSFVGLPVVVVTSPGADRTAPTVTLTSTSSAFNSTTITIAATFSESVTGFSSTGVVVTNGTVTNFTATDGQNYTIEITPTAEGAVTVSVSAGVATDAAGNSNSASTELTVSYDLTAPTPSISTTSSEPTSDTQMPFTVAFGEDVTGFDASDLSVTNGTVSNFTAVSASTYTFDVAPTTEGSVVVSISAGVATDIAGNANNGSNTVTRTFSGVIGLTANSLSTTLTTPTLTGTVDDSTATVTVTVGGQTITAAVTGNDWSAAIPTELAEGSYDIQVNAVNSAGKTGSLTLAGGLVIDLTAPVVASVTTTTPGPTNNAATYTVTFSEPVASASVDVNDFLVTVVSGSSDTAPSIASVVPVDSGDKSTSFIVTVNPGAGEGIMRLDVAETATVLDPAGNALSIAAGGFVSGDSVQFDTIAPAVEITSTTFDPTDVNPIPFTVVFGETVTGFDASDVAVSNGSVVNFAAASDSTYTFEVVPAGTGLIEVTLAAGSASDAAGNGNLVATLSRSFEGTVTTAVLGTSESDPTNADSIPVSVTFSGDVTGFDASDVVVVNGSVSNFTGTSASSYSFDVIPAVDGIVSVSIPAAAATDGAGSPTASAALSFVSDRTEPVANVATVASTNSSPIAFTITFSEDVTGFGEADVVVSNGSVTSFTAIDARTYTVLVVPAANGAVTLTVPAGATDAAGNAMSTGASGTAVYDTTGPSTVISSTSPEPTSDNPIPYLMTFSEDATGFDASDISVSNGTVSNFTATSASTYTFDVIPTGDGTIIVSVGSGAATDAAGNANLAADAIVRTFDGTINASGLSATMPDLDAIDWQTQADGLKIQDVQAGTGAAVTSGSTVEVYYTGWLAAGGTEFDSNRTDSTPATFSLSGLIEGWQEGLIGMQAGGIIRLYIPADLGYGDSASGSIPANSDLVFEIKLVSTT